jgi:predicted nucleotidyltransferase
MTKLHQAPQLPEVCQRFGVGRLALFGSALCPDFRPESDLDFLVEFLPMLPEERARAYFGLLEELEQIFNRPIDW